MFNENSDSAILKDVNGEEVALKGVRVNGRIHDLIAEIEVEQTYVNPQKINIEAVYTFPLPLGSTLLGLDVEIAGKKLTGCIFKKEEAEHRYEDAITDGNSAIMLQESGPGLYTVSVGNLMAGETAVIRYRYALLLSWQGNTIRLLLPTTIAPRYGDAAAAGLQFHQIPQASLSVEYPLDIVIKIEGELATASIFSPSHPIAVQHIDDGVSVKLSRQAYLDRDFIVTLQSEKAQSSCVLTNDGDSYVALASLRIPQVEATKELPLALKIVIDCSGSMAGASITQAKKASLEILNLLKPSDCFNLTLFGNLQEHLFPMLMPASDQNIALAWNRLENLLADMGGTEMQDALESVFLIGGSENKPTVLLITDGEIYEHEQLVQRAASSNHRIFTVGVGNSVAEAFLKSLSDKTDGACELVAPQEGMSERVLSQFHRMRQPKLGSFTLAWPTEPQWQTTLPETVFAGDTVQVFAGFQQLIEGAVQLQFKSGIQSQTAIRNVMEPQLPRLAAACRLESASKGIGQQLALQYQLLSRWTNYLVVAERNEQANDLPVTYQIPQMLTADWGGIGQARASISMRSPMPSIDFSVLKKACSRVESDRALDAIDIPSFLIKQVEVREAYELSVTPAMFIKNLAGEYSFFKMLSKPQALTDLLDIGLDDGVFSNLLTLVNDDATEEMVVATFLYVLSESTLGQLLGRMVKRLIIKRWKSAPQNAALEAELRSKVAGLTEENWTWGEVADQFDDDVPF